MEEGQDHALDLAPVTLGARVAKRSRVEDAPIFEVTAAIADAVAPDEVFEALVDRVAHVVGASSAGLWLVGDEGETATLVRSRGYSSDAARAIHLLSIDDSAAMPVLDCLRAGEPLWIPSQAALYAEYPHLDALTTRPRSYRISCLPLVAHGRVLGSLCLTIEESGAASDEEKEFLLLVARYATQAIERLRLYKAERDSRSEADGAAARLRVLNRISRAFSDADLELTARLRTVADELSRALDSDISIGLIQPDGMVRSIAAPEAAGAEAERRERASMGAALSVRGKVIGTVTARRLRDGETYTDEDLRLLEDLADRAAVAIENGRLYQETLEARARAEQLFRFAEAVVGADRVEVVYEAALDSIEAALGVRRAAILTMDDQRIMRFRAWRGLSDGYRAAVEGHSPWPQDATAPQPVVVRDALTDASWTSYAETFRSEGIGALAFIPVVSRGHLLGKFMLYYERPHAFSAIELETARAIANHLGSVVARFLALAKLEETVRYNELFAGVLAHDLRTPLSAILGSAQLLLLRQEGSASSDEASARPVGRIISSGQRMNAMIGQLLDFTRVRSGGGIRIERRATNLEEVCAQAIDEIELVRPEWTIHRDVTGDVAGTWDPERLVQVLSNVISNAGQHGQKDEPITVALDGRDAGQVLVEVHNVGVVAPAALPHLFDPFGTTRHRRGQSSGLGLGLFIVREIVRAHGGAVAVSSSEAAGTTVSIRLPR